MSAAKEQSGKLAANRRALHDYSVLERIEAGIALVGTEVKVVRDGSASLQGCFAKPDKHGLSIYGMHIPPYEQGNRFNHDPLRPRRLLLHGGEIRKLKATVEQKGLALIPLSLYLKHGKVKVELGLCKGKTHGDKRQHMRNETAKREADREMAKFNRR